MKKIKIILLLLLLTGCTVDYELNLNSDNTVEETVNFTETNDYLSKYGTPISNVVNQIKEFYLSGENNIEPEIIVKNKANFKNNDGNSATYKLKKRLDNIDDFSKSLFFNYYFTTSKVTTNSDKSVTIYGNKFNYDNVKLLTTSYKYKFTVDEIVVKIHCDYEVVDSNAFNVDKKTNTYYWFIKESNASNFELKLTYLPKKKFVYKDGDKINIIDKVAGSVIDYITFGNLDGEEFVKNNKIVPAFLVSLTIVIFIVIILFIRKRIDKANKI